MEDNKTKLCEKCGDFKYYDSPYKRYLCPSCKSSYNKTRYDKTGNNDNKIKNRTIQIDRQRDKEHSILKSVMLIDPRKTRAV
jgi:hypothetical protein